jgi:hypothetical protein
VGKCCLLYITACTYASTTVRERERYAVCEGCRSNSLGGVMWNSVPEEGLLHVKSQSTDVKCSSRVYVTLIVAQLKIIYCLHGEFEKNHEKHVRIVSLPAEI